MKISILFWCLFNSFIFVLTTQHYLSAQNYNTLLRNVELYNDSLQKSYSNDKQSDGYSSKINQIFDSLFDQRYIIENGKIYSGYFKISGCPFLFGTEGKIGEITISNLKISPINLLYNLYDDDVICTFTNKYGYINRVTLNKYLINSFLIDEKLFINFNNDSLPIKGFHEIIYRADNLMVLAKWTIKIIRNISNEQLGYFSEPKRDLIIIYKKQIIPVKKKKDIITFSQLNKSQIKQKKLPRISKVTNKELSEFFSILNIH